MVTAFHTLLEVCCAYACPDDIVYNTTKTVCLMVLPKQSQGRYSTRVRLGNQEIGFVDAFRYLEHVITADCRDEKYIEKLFRRKNEVCNMLVMKFSFAPTEGKIQLFMSYCCPIYGCALWRHSYHYIRKLTDSYSDTFKRLINVPRYTSWSRAFAMNTAEHINVVFRKSAYSFISRLTTSSNSIVNLIVNSAAYHQSSLMVKLESILFE